MATSAFEFVRSGVIEKASVHDMIYAACPRCFTSMSAQVRQQQTQGPAIVHSALSYAEQPRVDCKSCGSTVRIDALQYKYRLKLQVVYGVTVADAMLFDEAAEMLLGVSAFRMKHELLPKHPRLPSLLDELLVGLRVHFHFQRPAKTPSQYTKDLKIVQMEPLVPQLLPKPAVLLAIEYLVQ